MFYFHLMEEGKEKGKRGKKGRDKLPWGRRVSLGLDFPFWLCHRSQLLGAIKG
jgi:hypothetical protein